MAGLTRHTLTEPIYVRLPIEMTEEIRKQALAQERTLSLQIRWLLQKALQKPEANGDPDE